MLQDSTLKTWVIKRVEVRGIFAKKFLLSLLNSEGANRRITLDKYWAHEDEDFDRAMALGSLNIPGVSDLMLPSFWNGLEQHELDYAEQLVSGVRITPS